MERKHYFLQNRLFATWTTTGAFAKSLSEIAEIHMFFVNP